MATANIHTAKIMKRASLLDLLLLEYLKGLVTARYLSTLMAHKESMDAVQSNTSIEIHMSHRKSPSCHEPGKMFFVWDSNGKISWEWRRGKSPAQSRGESEPNGEMWAVLCVFGGCNGVALPVRGLKNIVFLFVELWMFLSMFFFNIVTSIVSGVCVGFEWKV